ncbi:Smr/MutS family protein [Adhaeribacter aquaticus]|uniref:Smr/MutS family protein n=1 Tax=Adhaeribacter aquaticus TaxID=299567 RepID=UPI0004147DC8|nr:Smr/MutS family protein [Adhaeribacter aquaticus]
MNIGDRVRLLHGREEGIITRFIGPDQVEIAIDNEFVIPVLRREIVLIAAEEGQFFRNDGNPVPETSKTKVESVKAPAVSSLGIYVALAHQSSELLAVTIINNSDYDLLFTYGEERENKYKGVASDKLHPKASKVVGHLHLKDFDKWPDLVLQFIQHRSNTLTLLEPGIRRIKFKASSFYKSKKTAPVINKEAYLFQVDVKAQAIDLNKLQDKLTEQQEAPTEVYTLKAPPHEVDLHIEKLTEIDPALMSNSEMLKLQLRTFQDNLDRALAANMHEIVFIHGTGNGVLRQEIHKILSRNKLIKYFEDARKEKFGYGATMVKLK